jgi:hypothetical protein
MEELNRQGRQERQERQEGKKYEDGELKIENGKNVAPLDPPSSIFHPRLPFLGVLGDLGGSSSSPN